MEFDSLCNARSLAINYSLSVFSLCSLNRTFGELLEGAFPAKLIKTCCLEDDKWKHAL